MKTKLKYPRKYQAVYTNAKKKLVIRETDDLNYAIRIASIYGGNVYDMPQYEARLRLYGYMKRRQILDKMATM